MQALQRTRDPSCADGRASRGEGEGEGEGKGKGEGEGEGEPPTCGTASSDLCEQCNVMDRFESAASQLSSAPSYSVVRFNAKLFAVAATPERAPPLGGQQYRMSVCPTPATAARAARMSTKSQRDCNPVARSFGLRGLRVLRGLVFAQVVTSGCFAPEADTPVIDAGLTICDIGERVFDPHCVVCHAEAGNAPFLTSDVAADIVDGAAADGVTLLVAPGKPDDSLLYRKIAGTQGAAEGDRMPLGGELDVELIEAVRAWIEQGASVDCDGAGVVDAGPDAVDGGVVDAGCELSCAGKQCGADGCGGTCGACVDGDECNGDGQCAPPCVPRHLQRPRLLMRHH